MAAPSEASSASDSSEEFDPESDVFDPLRALYGCKSKPLNKNVRIFDNVQQFESLFNAAKTGTLQDRLQKMAMGVRGGKKAATAAGVEAGLDLVGGTSAVPAAGCGESAAEGSEERLILPGRRFTESQAPVAGRKRRLRTVLTRIAATNRGPLARLKWCMDYRAKVQVYTRSYGRLRGVCTGYVVAFDKHWNLCLQDVDEVYQKKTRRKHVFLGDPQKVGERPPSPPPAAPALSTSVTEVTSRMAALLAAPQSRRSRRRPVFETHRRHCGQLFVRGDNVVLVATPTDSAPAPATATAMAAAVVPPG